MSIQENKVTESVVPGGQRSQVLNFYGAGLNAGLVLEGTIFDFMDRMCDTYQQAYWEMYRLSNGGFFMAPRLSSDRVTMSWPGNGSEEVMTPNAAGLVVTSMAYSHLAFRFEKHQEFFSDQFYLLREFILQHSECGAIFAVLD